MSDANAEKVIKTFTAMEARPNWESHWLDVVEHVLPNKDNIYRFSRSPGEKKFQRLYDATGVHSCVLLASALHSMLTNPTLEWSDFTTDDPELDQRDDVSKFLQNATRKMMVIINNSNFHTESHELYLDLASIGTGGFRTEEDDVDVVRFHADHISSLWVKENSKGVIDTIARLFKWTGEQIIKEFGEKSVAGVSGLDPERGTVDLTREYEVIHMVQPEVNYDPELKLDIKGKPFSSCYVLKELCHTLNEGGYYTFPEAVPRWTKVSGETYGRGPGMQALPDIKMIQQMMKTTIRGAQKQVDPPWMFPDDGVLLPLKLGPDSINYARAGTRENIFPLVSQSRIDFGFQMMEDCRSRIRAAFFIDQLQLKEGPQMTATEVQTRTEEQLRLMAPVLGRLHNEFLRPVIDRVFDICYRKGLFGEAPDILQGKKINVRFNSMIARAQRASEVGTLQRFLGTLAPMMESMPEIADNVDGDATARWLAVTLGLPHEILRDQMDVQKRRKAAADQQAEMMKQQQQLNQAEVVGKMAPAMQKA